MPLHNHASNVSQSILIRSQIITSDLQSQNHSLISLIPPYSILLSTIIDNISYTLMRNLNKTFNHSELPSPALPHHLASRILDLQLDYDAKNLTRDDLMELLSLYSQAVEFYEENRDKKYQVFQTRLTNVLKNPYVISILEGQSPNKIKQQQINELTKTAETTSGYQANQLVNNFANQKSRAENKIGKEIQSQKDKLLRRVMNRSFNKSFTTNPEIKERNDSVDLGNFIQKEKVVESVQKEKKPKESFLSFLDDRNVYEMPQRRKNIRALNI